jgi:hypothetical protein
MTLYASAVSFHVVTAILGLGEVTAIAIVATTTPARAPVAAPTWGALQALARGTTASLVLMLLSGVLIEYLSGGANHEARWFQLSFAGFLGLGALTGGIRRTLGKREALGDARTRAVVTRNAWVMCAITGVIAVLMEVKPW